MRLFKRRGGPEIVDPQLTGLRFDQVHTAPSSDIILMSRDHHEHYSVRVYIYSYIGVLVPLHMLCILSNNG